MVIFGGPVHVPADADRDTLENKRLELEAAMRGITARADSYWDGV